MKLPPKYLVMGILIYLVAVFGLLGLHLLLYFVEALK